MAKDPKKPKPTPEESAAKLAALTSGVASISHFGIKGPAPAPMLPAPKAAAPAAALATEPAAAPAPAPVVAEAAAEAVTTEPTATEPATVETGSAVVESTETASEPAAAAEPEKEQKGENDGVGEGLPALGAAPAQPVAGPPALPATAPEPTNEVAAPGPDATKVALDESSHNEEEASTDEQGPAAAPAAGEYDIASVFVPAKDKKTILVRITPDNQEFFMNLGTMLGAGASAPDIIHNILTQWREANEPKAKKAMQKRLREMLTKK